MNTPKQFHTQVVPKAPRKNLAAIIARNSAAERLVTPAEYANISSTVYNCEKNNKPFVNVRRRLSFEDTESHC